MHCAFHKAICFIKYGNVYLLLIPNKFESVSGMMCIYKKDIAEIGGFNKDQKTWGGEDLKFVKSVARNKDMKIIRYN